jgi:hypothetical protein
MRHIVLSLSAAFLAACSVIQVKTPEVGTPGTPVGTPLGNGRLSESAGVDERCADLKAALKPTAATVHGVTPATDPAKAMAAYVDAFRAIGEATQARQPPDGKKKLRDDLTVEVVARALELTAKSGIPFFTSEPGASLKAQDWDDPNDASKFACSTPDTASYLNRIAAARDAVIDLRTVVAGGENAPQPGAMVEAHEVPLTAVGAQPAATIRIPGDVKYVNCRTSLDGIKHLSNCDQVFGPDKGKAAVTLLKADAALRGVPTPQVKDEVDFVGRVTSISPTRDAVTVEVMAITRVRRADRDLYPFFDLAELR